MASKPSGIQRPGSGKNPQGIIADSVPGAVPKLLLAQAIIATRRYRARDWEFRENIFMALFIR
jgi:hypothetical protein